MQKPTVLWMRSRHHHAPPAVVPIEHIWVLLLFNSSRSCYMCCSVDAVELGFQGDIAQMCSGAELRAARQLNIRQAEGQVIQQRSGTFLGTEWICASTGCELLVSMGLHLNPSLFFLISKQTRQIKCYKKNYSSMSFAISISLFCSPIHLAEQASKEKCIQVHKGQEGLVLFFFFLFHFCNPFCSCLPGFWLVFYRKRDATSLRHMYFWLKVFLLLEQWLSLEHILCEA